MRNRQLDTLNNGEDIGHCGGLTFAVVAQDFYEAYVFGLMLQILGISAWAGEIDRKEVRRGSPR